MPFLSNQVVLLFSLLVSIQKHVNVVLKVDITYDNKVVASWAWFSFTQVPHLSTCLSMNLFLIS